MNPEAVVEWREALVRLTDHHFFDLMRMYLGVIKTPFNKQRLIEELSSFLRRKENRDRILSLLDDFDLMILSAVELLPNPSQQKMVSLFAGGRSFPEIYERILNLEERLLIYRRADADLRRYALNPLLEDALRPRLGLGCLLSPETLSFAAPADPPLDDLTFAALYSFFLHQGEAVRMDGTFRKRAREALDASFPRLAAVRGSVDMIVFAFQNLGLLVRSEGMLIPSRSRWEQFAELSPLDRLAWLASAGAGKASRAAMHERASFFVEFLQLLTPGAGYRKSSLARLAFILSENASASAVAHRQGRFASMIREQESLSADEASRSDFVQSALYLGLLAENDGLYCVNPAFATLADAEPASSGILISPTFEVTVMPGIHLRDLLPAAAALEVRDVQTLALFELTRRSCAAAFEQGQNAESLAALFSAKSLQPLPQNIAFSIADWFRAYASVSLYHGYVLRVDESRRALFENTPALSALIRKTLAPGVYLLDVNEASEISEAFEASGLDAPGLSTPESHRDSLPFPSAASKQVLSRSASAPAAQAAELPPDYAEDLKLALEDMDMDEDSRDALRSRIERRIILSPSQLVPDSVRVEKVEARGMDFLGKIKIAEYALAVGSLLEIETDSGSEGSAILGRPESMEKRTGDVILTLIREPDGIEEKVSLGKALLVRRIRGSIFSEISRVRPSR